MMETLQKVTKEATVQTAEQCVQPFVIDDSDLERWAVVMENELDTCARKGQSSHVLHLYLDQLGSYRSIEIPCRGDCKKGEELWKIKLAALQAEYAIQNGRVLDMNQSRYIQSEKNGDDVFSVTYAILSNLKRFFYIS